MKLWQLVLLGCVLWGAVQFIGVLPYEGWHGRIGSVYQGFVLCGAFVLGVIGTMLGVHAIVRHAMGDPRSLAAMQELSLSTLGELMISFVFVMGALVWLIHTFH